MPGALGATHPPVAGKLPPENSPSVIGKGVAGRKRAACCASFSVSDLMELMSSITIIPLPWVPKIRSFVFGCMAISRIKAYQGMLFFILFQFFPPSKLVKRPISVPRNSKSARTKSSFIL